MSVEKRVVICFGCGGHSEQANRVVSGLCKRTEFFSITDKGNQPVWSNEHLETGHIRDKYSGKLLSFAAIMKSFISIYRFMSRNKINCVISTGPGVSVAVALVARIMNVKVVHIESWSRFYSLSNTGKIMKFIAHVFIYQNHTLKNLSGKGKYFGRL
ncbi:PssD/Cps14F family polysaccharide biosynthesis glycosyltransferase [Vibrio vulnificus]|uniref:PssD/Cps14F family polysaccharide biosynthesis glycosyltransferase n=1 Tax=Vibrio vulnificus TaxID=672 RepID=UPI0019D4D84D|nr:polysaccharide biosynthesis protein [Vibrio vulnificus]ELR8747413.1 polysaccharide biosynthesis protein [Vibrio vulnificus]MBN8034084.1 polysaccharide biosynthesis protein [Vibrio vulnificus]HAS8556307.1 polysaccharide biosynthesis protein [Vibrio vulnificus]